MAYRLLQRGEPIRAGDEFLADDATTWRIDSGRVFVGMGYAAGVLRPARRHVDELEGCPGIADAIQNDSERAGSDFSDRLAPQT